ncbi:MAG TPA: pseudouridine synthase [Lacibacter sp.]|nr:pseudouridine synthase [Lacibacter sp.]HMO88879.1 pseudouridine synthase [Lacibacter sp.]HMP87671.1 pseudouridine synthase [Lacibacter sp.]
MANPYFQKFSGQKSNAQKKEELRQEKRKARAEKKAWFEEKKKQESGSRKPAAATGGKPAGAPVRSRSSKPAATATAAPAAMPLNKFIAHCGVCSRRDAVMLIKEEKVKVNNVVVTEPGYKVQEQDEIKVNGKRVQVQRELVYILLNKPKDYITTSEDPQGRKTIMDLMKGVTPQRIYPVGRLDRNTTGVLLLTNDGELTQKLSHPSFQVKKVYEVTLDRPLEKRDFEQLLQGVTLEDGFIAPDAVGYADAKNKKIIGIEIHSGRNRIVRRMFEHLGYDVKGLDRVLFANLSKKNVDRGKWRHLSEKEVRLLKFLNKSFVRKKEEEKARNRNEE